MEQCYAEFLCSTRRLGLLGFVVRRHTQVQGIYIYIIKPFWKKTVHTRPLAIMPFYSSSSTLQIMHFLLSTGVLLGFVHLPALSSSLSEDTLRFT